MIKAEVTVNGIIDRSATSRTSKEGKPFTTFSLKVNITGHNQESLPIEISIIKDGYNASEANQFTSGRRVEVSGNMTFKKRGERMYVNMSASQINMTPIAVTDSVEGTVEFRGTLGKQIDRKNDKNGKPYQTFSGFSTEKVDEAFEFTWIRFARFSGDECNALVPSGKIEAKGKLTLSVFREKLNIDCRVDEIKAWIKQPY